MQWLSGGRFEAGLGAGWLEAEVVGAGLPYPAPAARARRYREAMLIVRELFDTGHCTFQGEHYTVDLPVIGPMFTAPPPLVASVGGPWTIANVSPIADRVELKFGRTTRGGDLDGAAIATSSRDELRSMIEQVRAVAPTTPIGVFTMIAVGPPAETDAIREALGDGLYADFAGEPARVLDNLRALAGARDRPRPAQRTPPRLDRPARRGALTVRSRGRWRRPGGWRGGCRWCR